MRDGTLEVQFRTRMIRAIQDAGWVAQVVISTPEGKSRADVRAEGGDYFRWIECKAKRVDDNWIMSTPVAVISGLRPDQWVWLHDNACVNREPNHVASLVSTEYRFSATRAICCTVLAGSPAFLGRDYGVLFAALSSLPPGSGLVWPQEGLAVSSYNIGRRAAVPQPAWPYLQSWWLWPAHTTRIVDAHRITTWARKGG